MINRGHASIKILAITGTGFEVEARGVGWSAVVEAAANIVGHVECREPSWVGLSERRGRGSALAAV